MRPFQWVKNIILFLPMFFAQEIGDTDRLWNVAILFAGFCLLTSGVYIFNDLMDAGEDRLHPVKRFRPIASRKVSPMAALVFMFLLYATSALCFSFMYTSNNQIWLLSGGYILLNLAYTLYLKQVQIIDAMIVACGFIIRLEAGAAAGEIELSHWLIIMTFILSLFLAFAKRRDDLLNFMETGQISRKNITGYYKLGNSDLQAISASLRYFSLGEVNIWENIGDVPYGLNPYEMAFDVAYSRKLSESYSMAVTLRYIRSDMGTDQNDESNAGNAFSADISGYLEKYVLMGNAEALWSFGFNLSNIGSKISYDGGNTNQYLPAKLTLGTGLLYPIDDYNQIGVYLDLNKYMVPYAPQKEEGETDADYQTRVDDYKSWSSLSGMLKSFTDSPNGLLKEIMVSVGAEYSYNQQFFVRGGYFYENANVGNRKYFSVGAGFRMSVFQLDAAYLVSTVPQNPLDQTLRFSLSFDMDGIKNLFR